MVVVTMQTVTIIEYNILRFIINVGLNSIFIIEYLCTRNIIRGGFYIQVFPQSSLDDILKKLEKVCLSLQSRYLLFTLYEI